MGKKNGNQSYRNYIIYMYIIASISCLVIVIWQCWKTLTGEVNKPHISKYQSLLSMRKKWDYYPSLQGLSRPQYGILMGGTSDYFQEGVLQLNNTDSRGHDMLSMVSSTCIAKLYAMKHNYAFKVVKNLENISRRKYGSCTADHMSAWNKIALTQMYLSDVEYLLWLDLDALIIRPSVPLHHILSPNFRETTDLGSWMCAPKGTDEYHRSIAGIAKEPFFFASRDINPRYRINLNTGVYAVKNSPLGHEFLRRIWNVGEDENAFKKHDPYWRYKTPCKDYWGWPWEQGGVWDVLSDPNHLEFLKGTVFLPSDGPHAFSSITGHGVVPGENMPFILHGKDSHEMLSIRYIMPTLLESLKASSGMFKRECPYADEIARTFVNVSKHYKALLQRMAAAYY